ncbi:hypothetical protein GWL_29250 [Herbaspirillum sp. GW103]|nr:hypothetical protein GWL_29250 [Herbaspirillum sp. GW103]
MQPTMKTTSETGGGNVPQGSAGGALHVAFGVDSGYFRGMGAAIVSLLQHNAQQRFVFHVFAFAVSEDSRNRLDRLAQRYDLDIRTHLLDAHMLDAFRAFPCFAQHQLGTFIRLLIPNLLHGISDRVLYLDADLLCFGSIAALHAIELDGAIAAAVHDEVSTTAKTQIATLGLAKPEYFNAGVMLINVPEWIRADVQTRALTVLSTQQLLFADQDALNVALNGRVVYIGDEWNTRYHLVDYTSRGESELVVPPQVVFMHFTGPVKPWQDWCLHDARKVFLQVQDRSSWSDMPLDPPRTAREFKLYSKSLMKHGRWKEGICMHLRYLRKRSASKKR